LYLAADFVTCSNPTLLLSGMMDQPTAVLRDSSDHTINMPTDPATVASYSYNINLATHNGSHFGTPNSYMPRAYVPVHVGMGIPNGSPIYAHHQLGVLASPGLGFNDFDDMKAS
jgi:hypothetical protein